MALTVNTNTAATAAITNLGRTQRALGERYSHLSSGLRITKAADDAAGLGVAQEMLKSAQSGRQAIRNINDGVSIIQTAEGATEEITTILSRMRELAVQSSSDTLDDGERAYIQDEFEQISDELARIANVTEFNGVQLLDGSNTSIDVQVGINNTANDRISITLSELTATALGVDTTTLSLATSATARTALTAFDTAIDTVNSFRSMLGAVQNRLDSSLNNMETYVQNLDSAASQIRDADFAYETSEMAKQQILQQAGVAVLSQARNINQGVLNLLG